MLDRLLRDHRQIEAAADTLETVLGLPGPEMERLKEARWHIAKLMMQHLAYEDRHLYLPLEQHPRADVAAVARRFKVHLRSVTGDYEAHTASWTAAAMETDWAGYRAAARDQLDVLRARIKTEETELFPLARLLAADMPGEAPRHNWARAAWDVRSALDRS